MTGGDVVSTYLPDYGVREVLKDNRETPVWKLRFVRQLAVIGWARCDNLHAFADTRPTAGCSTRWARTAFSGATAASPTGTSTWAPSTSTGWKCKIWTFRPSMNVSSKPKLHLSLILRGLKREK